MHQDLNLYIALFPDDSIVHLLVYDSVYKVSLVCPVATVHKFRYSVMTYDKVAVNLKHLCFFL